MAYRGTLGDTAKGEVVRRDEPTLTSIMRERDDLVLKDLVEGRLNRSLIPVKYGISRRTLYNILARAPRRVRERIPMQPRPARGTPQDQAARAS